MSMDIKLAAVLSLRMKRANPSDYRCRRSFASGLPIACERTWTHFWRHAWFASAGLVLAIGSVQAAVSIDLGYVDTQGLAWQRFLGFVDQGINGTPGYGYSATDPAYAARVLGSATHCVKAVQLAEAQVADGEAQIALGLRPAIAYDSYLEIGPRLEEIALAYDWCTAQSTAGQRARWKAFGDQAIYNLWHPNQAQWGGNSFPWSGWSTSDPGNNYYYSFMQASILWAEATNDSNLQAFLTTDKMAALQNYAATLMGGGSREGTGYGTAHMRLFYVYRLWRDAGFGDIANANSHLSDSLRYWVHATVPTRDRFAPIGDQSRNSLPELYDYQRRLVLEARALSNDSAARDQASWWLQNISVPAMQSGFNFRHDLLPAGSTATAPTALYHHATGAGHLFARSSWSTDASWIAFVAGIYDQSHAHQDQGALTFFAGDWLAVTSNIFSHSGINQHPEVHNVIRFERNGQTLRQWEGTQSSMIVTPGANGAMAIDAQLAPAYNAPTLVQSWRREVAFAGRQVLLTDTIGVANDVHPVWQLNVPNQPLIQGRTATAGALIVEVIEPVDAQLTVVNWHSVDPVEFNGGFRIDVRGSGNRFVVRLNGGEGFANGFE